jgi:hypothetical protein
LPEYVENGWSAFQEPTSMESSDEATILSWRNNKYYVPVKQKSSTDSIGLLKAKPPGG